MINSAVKKTFDILKKKGITKEFLYKDAETKDSFNISLQGSIKEFYDKNLHKYIFFNKKGEKKT